MEFPLFCSAPRRLTASSAWHEHIPFAMYLIEAMKPGIIVELGVYRGDSYCSFCQAVQDLNLNTHCFAVDTWKGDEQGGFFGPEVLEDLRAHHSPLYGGFSKLLQCSFDDALPHFENGTIDLIHIDGYHTYTAVKHDFNSWLPKLSRRGIVLLHDINEREGDFGVWRLWDEIKREYPHFEFLHCHGLGVLGVGTEQPDTLRELFQASDEEVAGVRNFFSRMGERISLQVANNAEVERLHMQLAEARLQLDLIQESKGWKILQSIYHFRDKLLPKGSKRRKSVEFLRRLSSRPNIHSLDIKKFIWYCRIYGFKNALRLAARKFHQPSMSLKIKIRPLSLPSSTRSSFEEGLQALNKKVSVVVPTKNAGRDFQILLKKLKSQKGLRECEIIIVDSGSTDGTLEVARREGTKVIEIPPESFNHGDARNKGAECATGDYVLFLVQDALPMTDRWLWEMAKTLEQNNTVAVSCAEYPRSDCDLFYQHLIWNHYRTLNLDKDRILSWDDSCSSQIGLRSNSQISDIAALVKRDIFNYYKFKTKYAEDLDLGIRLIKDGHRIGALYTTRILHSHNRPAFYFLKRSYVDSKFLKEVFPEFQFPAVINGSRIFQDMAAIYYTTKHISSEISKSNKAEGVSNFFDRIKSMYSVEQNAFEDIAATTPENDFEGFVRDLALSTGESSVRFRYKENILVPHFLQQLGVLQAFISQSHKIVDEIIIQELEAALFKILALHSGAHIAYLYLTLTDQRPCDEFLAGLDRQLVSGI
jgi:glycosyltransferase involved in cell wall biosynthesis